MEKKYPVLKCTEELWEEIKPTLESFGITDFSNITYNLWRLKDPDKTVYLVTNYGGYIELPLLIGNTWYRSNETINVSPRYLVNTKEEFLSAVAKLLGKTYPNYGSDYDIDLIKSKERKYLGENDRIHCSTEEEARKVIDIYYILGYKWASSKKEETNYGYHNSNSVYNLEGVNEKTIKIGDVNTSKAFGKNIIPASEFINYYTSNNMEKRNIQIDKETARKWYNGNDNTLKELALQAYKKEELKTISYYEILGSVNTTPNYHHIPHKQSNKWTAIHKLAIIAEYLNEGWKPDWTNINENKYFIYKDDKIKVSYVSRSRECMIYFKSKELAQKAIEIMSDEINNIFD